LGSWRGLRGHIGLLEEPGQLVGSTALFLKQRSSAGHHDPPSPIAFHNHDCTIAAPCQNNLHLETTVLTEQNLAKEKGKRLF